MSEVSFFAGIRNLVVRGNYDQRLGEIGSKAQAEHNQKLSNIVFGAFALLGVLALAAGSFALVQVTLSPVAASFVTATVLTHVNLAVAFLTLPGFTVAVVAVATVAGGLFVVVPYAYAGKHVVKNALDHAFVDREARGGYYYI